VPIIARLVSQAPGLELRVILRDKNPELMDQYLTDGARSIPIVIALDDKFQEVGHWGPRPAALQVWVMANQATTPKAELYPQVRKWYARDRGETTLREVLEAAGFQVPVKVA
ncbi:MAG: thioredoxin family protein, partial [Gemmatimonadales bacterium]